MRQFEYKDLGSFPVLPASKIKDRWGKDLRPISLIKKKLEIGPYPRKKTNKKKAELFVPYIILNI